MRYGNKCLPFLYSFPFRILSFSVGREAIFLSVKLKIDLERKRSKEENFLSQKNLYRKVKRKKKEKKRKSFSQVTQRRSLRVRTKIDPMLRPEFIFNPLHQGRTYSPENNIFCITVDTYQLTEGRVGKLEVKKHEGRVDSETL